MLQVLSAAFFTCRRAERGICSFVVIYTHGYTGQAEAMWDLIGGEAPTSKSYLVFSAVFR